jgi:hypothetical protein
MIHLKWSIEQESTDFILSTSSPKGSTRRISSTRGFLEYFINVIRLPHQLHHHFVVDMVRHEGASPTTSSSTCVRLEGLSPSTSLALIFSFIFDVYFIDVDRTPARGALSSTSSTPMFDFVFDVYYTDADWAVAQGASSSTSSTSTQASFSSTSTSSHAMRGTRAFVTITGQEG